jgi:excisionase family DNA binding protein
VPNRAANRAANRNVGGKHAMAQLSEWVSVSEAVRLSGLSTRTLKRMAEEGRIKFSRSPGGHLRIARRELDGLLRHSANASAPVSSVLQNRKENVEELVLQSQELRAKRELERMREEDEERDRQRVAAQRAEAVARELALAEQRLRRASELERRKREQREAQTAGQQAEFERHWFRFAKDRVSILNWLSIEQRHAVMDEVSFEIRAHGPEEGDAMEQVLSDTIARVCAPWVFERDVKAKREKLLEESLWALSWYATNQEKARAAADARVAIAQIPLTAEEWEIRAALSAVIEPIRKALAKRDLEQNVAAVAALYRLVGR